MCVRLPCNGDFLGSEMRASDTISKIPLDYLESDIDATSVPKRSGLISVEGSGRTIFKLMWIQPTSHARSYHVGSQTRKELVARLLHSNYYWIRFMNNYKTHEQMYFLEYLFTSLCTL